VVRCIFSLLVRDGFNGKKCTIACAIVDFWDHFDPRVIWSLLFRVDSIVFQLRAISMPKSLLVKLFSLTTPAVVAMGFWWNSRIPNTTPAVDSSRFQHVVVQVNSQQDAQSGLKIGEALRISGEMQVTQRPEDVANSVSANLILLNHPRGDVIAGSTQLKTRYSGEKITFAGVMPPVPVSGQFELRLSVQDESDDLPTENREKLFYRQSIRVMKP